MLGAASLTSAPTAQILRRLALVGGVAVGYGLCGFVGTALSLPPSGFAILWPATAFLTAVFLITPPRDAWLVVLVVVPAHLILTRAAVAVPPPLPIILLQAAGNLGPAAATAFAVRRASRGPVRLDSFRSLLVFMLLAAVIVPALINPLILAAHMFTGRTQDVWLSWRQWMLASIFPTITLAPLMVLTARRKLLPSASPRLHLEVGAFCLVLLAVSLLVFAGHPQTEHWPALLLAPLPLLLWATVRGGIGGASLALLIFAGAIIVQALSGNGPFGAGASTAVIQSLQVYLISISIPLILLAALMDERRLADEQLRRSEARIEIAAASTDTGLWQWDQTTQEVWATDHCRAMFGLGSKDVPTLDAFIRVIHRGDRPRVLAALAGLETADVEAMREFRVVRGHQVRWFILRTHSERDREGRPIRVSGVFRDITRHIEAQHQAEQLSRRLLTLQEDERRSIAAELHDSTGQHLAALGLTLQGLRRRLKPTPAIEALFEDLQTSLAAASTELRTFTFLLRPPELERRGLAEVLRQYVTGFGRRAGLTTRLRFSPRAEQAPMSQRRALLRITQEALTNVYRHAQATRVTVRLSVDDRRLHLVIADDGAGIPPAGATGAEPVRLGVGIPGMAARIRQLGGRLAIRSDVRGTLVHVVLPLGEVAPKPAPATPRRSAKADARRVFTETLV